MAKKTSTASSNEREERINIATGKALQGLENGFNIAGRTHHKITGLSIKINPTDVLITVKAARTAEGPMIAFVGSSNLRKALRKAFAEYRDEKLEWKLDEWEMKRFDDEDDYL